MFCVGLQSAAGKCTGYGGIEVLCIIIIIIITMTETFTCDVMTCFELT